MNLNEEPAIIGMANSLNLDVTKPVEAIRAYCRERVWGFQRRGPHIDNIDELQRLVCRKLFLVIEEIWSDDDLKKLECKYKAQHEIAAGAAVGTQFRTGTFGMLVQLLQPAKNGSRRFVAFIDCRGDKALRRIWTIWHEISHCLTAKNQLALPLRRTSAEIIEKDPEEKLTDIIASDLAFYEPLFYPVLESEFLRTGRMTFLVAERVRKRFNPMASFESTLNACVSHVAAPVILLEAGLALKKCDERLIAKGKLDRTGFIPHLRVLKSIPNKGARDLMPHIPRQMRVPAGSVIAEIHSSDRVSISTECRLETLGNWTSSHGSSLPEVDVMIEARKFGERVLAIVTQAA